MKMLNLETHKKASVARDSGVKTEAKKSPGDPWHEKKRQNGRPPLRTNGQFKLFSHQFVIGHVTKFNGVINDGNAIRDHANEQ